MSRFRTLALTGAFVFLMTTLAAAQAPSFFFLPMDRTFNNPFIFSPGSVIVGYEKLEPGTYNTFLNASSPTITLISPPLGNPISSLSPWYVYHDSTVVVDNATNGGVTTYNNANLILQNNGQVGRVTMHQNSHSIFNSGSARSVEARNFTQLTMSGGQIGNGTDLNSGLTTRHGATATVTGALVYKHVDAVDRSTIDLVSSEVRGQVFAYDTAGVTVVGSTIGSLGEVSGGQIYAAAHGSIGVTSSTVWGNVLAGDDAQVALDSTYVSGDVVTSDTSSVIMTEYVTVEGVVAAHDGSDIYMSNSTAQRLVAASSGVFGVSNSIIHDSAETIDNATLNLFDGSIVNGNLTAQDDSHVNVDDSRVSGNNVFAYHRSVITISNDSYFDGDVTALSNASIIVNGGNIRGRLVGLGESDTQLIGGSAGEGVSSSLSNFIMSGGLIDHNLTASSSGKVNLFGGQVEGDLVVTDTATANMAGGFVAGTLQLSGNGVFNRSGGTFGHEPPPPSPGGGGGGSLSLLSEGSLAGQGAGGMLGPGLIGHDSSTINLFGPDLEATLVDPNFEGMFSVYQLTGRLADGTPIGGEFLYIQNETGASFQLFLVPEPGGFALACLAVVGGLLRRRKK